MDGRVNCPSMAIVLLLVVHGNKGAEESLSGSEESKDLRSLGLPRGLWFIPRIKRRLSNAGTPTAVLMLLLE